MATEIKQSQLRNDNASVMRRVAAGESFVVTVNGRPVADVVPHRPHSTKRAFVPVAEVAAAFAADPDVDAASWLADIRAADEFFAPDYPTDPWEDRR